MTRRAIHIRTRIRKWLVRLGRCCYCGDHAPILGPSNRVGHLDHVIPHSRGGANFANLEWSCRSCNLRKHTETWEPTPLTATQRFFNILLGLLFMDVPELSELPDIYDYWSKER